MPMFANVLKSFANFSFCVVVGFIFVAKSFFKIMLNYNQSHTPWRSKFLSLMHLKRPLKRYYRCAPRQVISVNSLLVQEVTMWEHYQLPKRTTQIKTFGRWF